MSLSIDPIQVSRQALAVQPDRNVSTDSPEQLRKVCQQFEAVFLQNLLKQMRATVPEGGLIDNSNDYQIYREMLDAQIAQDAASRGDLGIGKVLYRQLAAKLPPTPPDDPTQT